VKQYFWQYGEFRDGNKPCEKSVVLCGAEHILVADAVFIEDRGAEHTGRMAQVAVDHKHLLDFHVCRGAHLYLTGRYALGKRAHYAHFGMRIEEGHLLFEAFRQGDVIVIHHGQIFALSHIQQAVACAGNAEVAFVFGVDDALVVIGLHHLFHIGVGRSIVEHEELKVRERLRKYAVYSFTQVFGFGVIHGHGYGYAGHE